MALSRWTYVIAAVVLAVIALVVIRLHGAGGQDVGDAASGRRLVEAWCTECHSVEPATATTGRIAPDFSAVAQRRATTALTLKVFLQSTHKTMPNFIIQPRDADDIAAYILSLRRR